MFFTKTILCVASIVGGIRRGVRKINAPDEHSALVREHAVALLHVTVLSAQQGPMDYKNAISQRNAEHEVQPQVTPAQTNTMEKLVPIV